MSATPNIITLPPPSMPLVTEDGKIERSWYICLRQIISQIGGFTAPPLSSDDLQQLADEDSDIDTSDTASLADRVTALETKLLDPDLQEFASLQDAADALQLSAVALDSVDAFVIPSSSITNSQLAAMAARTLKGNATGAAAAPQDLTQAQVTALLNVFTNIAQGLVPPSGSTTGKWFLRDDGTWSATLTGGLAVTGGAFASRGIADNATANAVTINAAGAVVVTVPTSGPALTLGGFAAVNVPTQQINGSAVAGQSNGVFIQAGVGNAGDRALDVLNQAGTLRFFGVFGDGTIAVGVATTTAAPGAGGAGALPATPAGYMTLTVGATPRKIPYY